MEKILSMNESDPILADESSFLTEIGQIIGLKITCSPHVQSQEKTASWHEADY